MPHPRTLTSSRQGMSFRLSTEFRLAAKLQGTFGAALADCRPSTALPCERRTRSILLVPGDLERGQIGVTLDLISRCAFAAWLAVTSSLVG